MNDVDTMFIDFLNSEMYDGHGNLKDRIGDARWVAAFRRKWGLDGTRSNRLDGDFDTESYFRPERQPSEPAASTRRRYGWDPDLLDALMELRALLRGIVDRVASGGEITGRHVAELDRFLEKADARHRLRRSAEGLHLETVPLEDGDGWLIGAIALSAARSLTSGDPHRLKTCGNEGCRWVFYDETKNRSRRWCNSNLCGNLIKVRRYRSRHRSGSSAAGGRP